MLLRMMHTDSKFRLACASALGSIGRRKSIRVLQGIGRRELRSVTPDVQWLWAVILGLKYDDDPKSAELLITIYERSDLPGWLRGDAGDALGCSDAISNRRSPQYTRILRTALEGISSGDIEVEFWSMYVVSQLATVYSGAVGRKNDRLHPALPRLREIAKTDHRLAPGLWWQLSEEAKDAIHCIRTGALRKTDAADRWAGNPQRGESQARP